MVDWCAKQLQQQQQQLMRHTARQLVGTAATGVCLNGLSTHNIYVVAGTNLYYAQMVAAQHHWSTGESSNCTHMICICSVLVVIA
jgi:hypothetical protein